MKIKSDFIISINIHENVPFLLKQLDNISNHLCSYYIILNCNNYMQNELKNVILPDNVIVNSEIIEKERFHGTLTKGIYSNMKYAYENFEFSYFIVLSSRNLFYNKLNIDFLNSKQPIWCHNNKPLQVNAINNPEQYKGWHWPVFLNTALAKHYISINLKLVNSAHEGLVFHYNVCDNIIKFLETNIIINTDLFKFHGCVEEFSLQTIAINEISHNNYYGYIYIGHGTETQYHIPNDPTRFVYKTIRKI